MSVRYIVGDVLDVLRSMPDASVDLVLSSPPFLALRSYLPADHPDKAKEIGSEPTPGEFIDTLLDVTEECRRVLTPHGSLCFELGDTYAGSGGAGGDYGPDGMRGGQNKFTGAALADRKNKVLRADGNRLQQGDGWPLDKSLCLVPELLRIAMVYGVNPLTGRSTPRWRARNVVRWARPNPPVGALGDKFRPATSDILVACVGRKRYFDLDSCRSLAPRPANGASLGAAAIRRELDGALHTPDGAYVARWWCDLREAKVSVDSTVARNAEGQEVVELVGLKVGVETPEGHYVVDLEAVRGSTSLAGVPVAVQRSLPGFLPVGASVSDPPAAVGGAVLSTPVSRAPGSVALKAAEVVSLDGARVSGDRLAARLTLKVNGAVTYAWFIAPITASSHASDPTKSGRTTGGRNQSKRGEGDYRGESIRFGTRVESHAAGAPPLDHWWFDEVDDLFPQDAWHVSTEPYKGSHYATWPTDLCVRPILAMCPAKVCTTCGKPSERIVEVGYERAKGGNSGHRRSIREPDGNERMAGPTLSVANVTTGWTTCGHETWRQGVVLDPFAGSGTTLLVASGHGRSAVGIDLDERNADLARERVGMWLEVELHPVTAGHVA